MTDCQPWLVALSGGICNTGFVQNSFGTERRSGMNFNEKLISLRKSKGLSQEELGAQLKVSRQIISKWESAQSYPDFQRLVLLSDYFGLTLDELVKDVDVQEVREKNASSEKIDAIYQDVRTAKRFVKWYLVAGGIAAGVVLALLLYFAVNAVFVW